MAVPGFPVALWQYPAQFHLGFERFARLNDAEQVADAVHMHIDADCRQIEADGDRQVGCLAADPRQFAQFLDGVRQHTAEATLNGAGQRFEMARLVAVEADRIDQPGDFSFFKALEIGGRETLARSGREKPAYRPGGAAVFGASRKNCPYQHAERIVRLGFNQFDDWRRMGGKLACERSVDGGDVARGPAQMDDGLFLHGQIIPFCRWPLAFLV